MQFFNKSRYYTIALFCILAFNNCTNNNIEELEKEIQLLIILRCKLDLASDCAIDSIQPDAIAGLRLWLKADSFSSRTDGSAVSGWVDSSGQGKDALQATTANQPKYYSNQINGKPTVRFDGVDDILITPSISVGSFTMLSVFNVITTGDFNIYEHGTNTNTFSGNYFWASNNYTMLVNRGATRSGKILSLNWASTGVNRITAQLFNGTHSSHLMYNAGTLQSLSDSPDTSDPGTSIVTASFYVGARSGPSDAYNGNIAEIIVYNSSLSDAERQGVECYLSKKYGINVSQFCG